MALLAEKRDKLKKERMKECRDAGRNIRAHNIRQEGPNHTQEEVN